VCGQQHCTWPAVFVVSSCRGAVLYCVIAPQQVSVVVGCDRSSRCGKRAHHFIMCQNRIKTVCGSNSFSEVVRTSRSCIRGQRRSHCGAGQPRSFSMLLKLCIPAATSGKNAHGVGDPCRETRRNAARCAARRCGAARCWTMCGGRPSLWGRQQGGPGAVWTSSWCPFAILLAVACCYCVATQNKHNSAIVEAYDDVGNLPVLVPFTWCVGSLHLCARLWLGCCVARCCRCRRSSEACMARSVKMMAVCVAIPCTA
jgi:hypothetical protein